MPDWLNCGLARSGVDLHRSWQGLKTATPGKLVLRWIDSPVGAAGGLGEGTGAPVPGAGQEFLDDSNLDALALPKIEDLPP